MPWLAYRGQSSSSSNVGAFFAFEFHDSGGAVDLVLSIKGAWHRTCAVDPFVAFLVLRAEELLAVAVVALNPVVKAVVEGLGFARLRFSERLVRDKDAASTIAGDLGKSPVPHEVTRLVLDLSVTEHHVGADAAVGVFDAPANRARQPLS